MTSELPLRLQGLERVEQRLVVARVQADGRLIQHVEHAAQVRAELRREPDALRFAAAQRLGRAAEREVIEPDARHEFQPLADLRQDVRRDDAVGLLEPQFPQQGLRVAHGFRGDIVDGPVADADVARDGVEPRALAARAGHGLAFIEPLVLALFVHLGLERALALGRLRGVPDLAKAAADRTPAVRGIEREEARIEFLEGVAALRAIHFRAEDGRMAFGIEQPRRALADLERALDQRAHLGLRLWPRRAARRWCAP